MKRFFLVFVIGFLTVSPLAFAQTNIQFEEETLTKIEENPLLADVYLENKEKGKTPILEFKSRCLSWYTTDPELKLFAYVISKGEMDHLIVNGISRYSHKNLENTFLLPDGRWMMLVDEGQYDAFAAGGGKDRFLLLDGKEGPHFEEISYVTWSSDGRHIAYQGVEFQGFFKSNEYYIVIDNDVRKVDVNWGPIFSGGDQPRPAYRYSIKNKEYVVIGEKEFGPYPVLWPISSNQGIVFSADGKRFAFPIRTEKNKQALVIDDRVSQVYDTIESSPVFSEDGQHIAFIVRQGKEYSVILDDKPVFTQKFPINVAVFFDGQRLALIAQNAKNQRAVFVDGVPGPFFKNINYLTFSPNGKRITYVVETYYSESEGSRYAVIIDGKQDLQEYQTIRGPVFTSDSQHLIYAGFKADNKSKWFVKTHEENTSGEWYAKPFMGRWHIIVDGAEKKDYGYIYTINAWDPDPKKFRFLSLEKDTVYRVTAKIGSNEKGDKKGTAPNKISDKAQRHNVIPQGLPAVAKSYANQKSENRRQKPEIVKNNFKTETTPII